MEGMGHDLKKLCHKFVKIFYSLAKADRRDLMNVSFCVGISALSFPLVQTNFMVEL